MCFGILIICLFNYSSSIIECHLHQSLVAKLDIYTYIVHVQTQDTYLKTGEGLT